MLLQARSPRLWSPSSSRAGRSSQLLPSPACERRICRELVTGSLTSALSCKVQVPLRSSPHPDPRALHFCTRGRGHIRICVTHVMVTGYILWDSGRGKSRCGPASECFLSHDGCRHSCACAPGQRKTFPDLQHLQIIGRANEEDAEDAQQPSSLDAQEGPSVP